MSEEALKALNSMPGLEGNNESSCKEDLSKQGIGIKTANGNIEELKSKSSASIRPLVNGESSNPVAEVGSSEVEYIESENLTDIEDVSSSLQTLLAGLGSKDWVSVCEALNNTRRLAIYHREDMLDMLGDVISLLVKSMKNPRSAVCKTSLMTSADIFIAYNDEVIESLDPMLLQLLLKASQDKRFVCEAAEKALVAMTSSFSPALLLPKLEPYLKNRNPRIRAKASMCFCRSVPRLGVEGIKAHGIDKLIQTAASQLSDQLPESREAARILLVELQSVYEKFTDLPTTTPEDPEKGSWEDFCQSKLSPLSAQAVLRIKNVSREGIVSSS
ncbi:uncharacterized protein LOC111435255 [Cucurbita moschata]|uniref:Uncharacterized protein LOC111435255 n=1 Tax=Cucurbita moschata TaxID=3662 RepID=A0A6J1ERP5_CUCMO|nr:uncharacterized protein LOC111435255 [Cucurbita moschata]XP_022928445.1 uncharacterized protein LOC111435255 [Cucurbita moschata]XP_022928446.1 uncharacterized protein LOC111435255 [Cucurbita moschata]XP_022928447.1 uncharacterized protein LOC111435255 [Cucurbita moschata]